MSEAEDAPPPAKKRKTAEDDSVAPESVAPAPELGSNGTSEPVAASRPQIHTLPVPQVPPPETWDVSFFGVEPIEEMTDHVAQWLYECCRGRQNVEIEAKIGTLVGMGQGNLDRLNFPVETETILREPSQTRFESTMTQSQHRHYNSILNERVEQQKSPTYRGPRLRYEHTREIDRFFSLSGGGRTRVTTDAATGQLKAGGIITKRRVADLNIYSPKHPFDVRISVNIEEPADMPQSSPTMTRNKDRVSYQYDLFKIDLTQVADAPKDSTKGKDLRHELEIEFLRPDILVYEGDLHAQNDPNSHFHHMVQIFLNNIHMLIRNASAP